MGMPVALPPLTLSLCCIAPGDSVCCCPGSWETAEEPWPLLTQGWGWGLDSRHRGAGRACSGAVGGVHLVQLCPGTELKSLGLCGEVILV